MAYDWWEVSFDELMSDLVLFVDNVYLLIIGDLVLFVNNAFDKFLFSQGSIRIHIYLRKNVPATELSIQYLNS